MTMLRLICLTGCVCFALACSSGTTPDASSDEDVARATQAAVASNGPWLAEAALPVALWRPGDAPLDAATLALDGERMVLIPPGQWHIQEAYAAYVYVKRGSIWRYEDLVPEDDLVQGLRLYGRSVALSGDLMLVSSAWSSAPAVYRAIPSLADPTLKQWVPGKNALDAQCAHPPKGPYELGLSADTALVSCVGDGVHVYTRSGAGLAQLQTLSPPPGHALQFGRAVAVDKNTIAIAGSGAVHLYARYGGRWHHQQTEQGATEKFAAALSLSGDTLVVAGSGGTATAATVYTRMGSTWTVQQELTVPAGTQSGPEPSISVSGDTVFFSPDGVSAFVYSRLGSRWSAGPPLRFDDATPKRKLAVSGGHGVVTGPSYASIFDASGSTWRAREGVDIGSRHTIGTFGKVAISGTRAAVVGKAGKNVEVFALSESRWRSEQVLPLLGADHDAHVWLEGKHLLVIPRRRVPQAPYAAPRVYARDTDSWSEPQELVADDGAILDGGGAVLKNRVIVGDYRNQAAYVFLREGSRWRQEKKLTIPVPVAEEKFGWSLAMDEQRVIIGSPTARLNEDTTAPGVPGAAYVFARSTWKFEAQLTPPEATNESFGDGVALLDDVAVVSAPTKGLRGDPHVHTFVRVGTAWKHMDHLQPDPARKGNVFFGTSIGLLKDTLAIGSLALPPGETYVYARVGNHWREEQRINDLEDATLGAFVAATEGRLLVGAMMEPPRVYRRARQMPQAGPCSSSDECATGHCVDGVCCNELCSGACQACANSLTNEPDGTCGVAMAGTRCSNDALKCSTDSQTEYALASTCDASGTCQRRSVACQGGLKCTEPGYCPWKCNAFGDPRHDLCPDQTWCDVESGRCEPQKHGLQACSGNEQCLSGRCKELVDAECVSVGGARCKRSVCLGDKGDECGSGEQCAAQLTCTDGVCCDSACTGVCESCNQDGSRGTCSPIPANQQPTGTKRCPGEGICKPACDGSQRDTCQPSTAICREAACDEGFVIKAARCVDHRCPEEEFEFCEGFACDPNSKTCKRRCNGNEDCVERVCEGRSCVEPLSRCKDNRTIVTRGSGERKCPGRCEDGDCDNSCSQFETCSEGYACVSQHCVQIDDAGVPTPAAPDGGGQDGGDSGSGAHDGGDGGQPDTGVDDGGGRDDDSGSCACRAAGSSLPGSARHVGLLALTAALALSIRRSRKIGA
jgi:hypothetical protein